MNEFVEYASPSKLRKAFSFILIHGEPNNPHELWESFRAAMMEDYLRHHPEVQAEQMVLGKIKAVIQQFGKRLTDFGLPALQEALLDDLPNAEEMRQEALNIRPLLNAEQLHVADSVINVFTNNNINVANIFFLDGPGGTGKTFTYNYIIKEVIARNLCVATCAWTGIAATLLPNGKTVHSLFKLPVPVLDGCTCNIKPNSDHAAFLRRQDIIIFDEASMIPKYALEAIDRMFRDICNSEIPFAGKVILLGGDFRQVLPVIRRAGPAQIVEVCLKSSQLWPLTRIFHLHTNMRAGEGEQVFAEFLLNLGGGHLPQKPDDPNQGCIEIPHECVLQPNENIVTSIFSELDDVEFSRCVILTPTNEEALEINEQILNQIPGDTHTYYSIDSVVSDDQEEIDLYPMEFINSLTPSGMPPHQLNVKVGCVVMLLRNLSLKDGLCNGTRLMVRNLRANVIDCEILTGIRRGDRVLIPRVSLCLNDTNLPFQIKRTQFPLRLSYALTIKNRSQSQTFEKVGIYLRRPCFSHGQLYVAFSRARSFAAVKVKVVSTYQQGYVGNRCFTKNVVFPQVL
ncbi:ATP-dependent DNA helicase pif1-like isoform X1 [Hydractinia symbiolongicarpus]|uniref:ATP-dependent DNA helicase pif1-like isoform X1 n=1 Tax=Hydractinia symbiolongicarpus TaxID=13093 RepID=UPI00254B02EE|nr:ATP-dependent DNA helicase pif1-like isoform X1 [Hydractinia symbiolongicarpus]XP_057291717.1 ATP-dependent DNA helicase pif1-like isoform X1 [Hydractinia symbiolongicarpus]XP_057291718.1 ATP-dependent DNA helicase pif1-like isoform X1 [Hydractinia symbiolongicarpus]